MTMPTAKLIVLLLAALSMGALLGVGSASATAICEDEPIEGECAVPYETGTELAGEAKDGLLKAGSIEVKCTKSTIEGEITEEPTGEEEPLAGTVSSFAFSGCSGCETVGALHLPYASSTAWTEEANADTTLQSGGTGEPALKVSACKGGISCVYKASKPVIKFTGGEPGELVAKFEPTLVKEESSPSCSSSAQFSATYVLNQPPGGQAFAAPRRLRATVLCEAASDPCPALKIWTFGLTTLKAVSEGKVELYFYYEEGGKYWEKFQECNSEIRGQQEIWGAPLKGKFSTVNFTQCVGACSVGASRTPFLFQLEAKRAPNGKGNLVMESGGTGAPDLTFACGGFNCNFEHDVSWEIIGGSPATFEISAGLDLQNPMTETKCSGYAIWKGKYKFVSPQPMYVEREEP